jgi:gluconolactonase
MITGSNGLVKLYADPNAGADIVACQHGERAVAVLFENGTRVFLATHYQGKRLNSPNDLAWSNEGHLYFTDPAYGLYDKQRQVLLGQELTFSGVYMIHRDEIKMSLTTGVPTDKLQLVTQEDEFNIPNGITFSPGFVKAYVSNSDSKNAYWKVFDLMQDGSFANGRVFYNATSLIEKGHLGNPDGMKVDSKGNLYASGPGGVLVFAPEGKLMGRLITNKTVSNVAFGANGMLYMTASDAILRVKINTRPAKVVGAWK